MGRNWLKGRREQVRISASRTPRPATIATGPSVIAVQAYELPTFKSPPPFTPSFPIHLLSTGTSQSL